MMLKAVNIKKNFDLDKTKLQILRDTLFSYVSVPLSMIIITALATYLGARGLSKMNISQILKEDV